jgi:RNA polymerase sporulation-specific sigma factor
MNKKERNELVTENVKLAYHFAHLWKRKAYWLDINELLSTAQYGLLKAANTFDPEKEIKFSTYAGKVIQNEILLLMRSIKNRVFTISLEASINGPDSGDKETTLEDSLPLEDPIKEWTTNHVLLQCIEGLSEKEQKLIYYHYMQDMKQADLAKIIGVQQPQIARMIKQTLEKMRKVLKEN